MNAVVSVIGKDRVGILARVSTECANANANVLEVTQTLLRDTFAMTMLVDIDHISMELSEFVTHMAVTRSSKIFTLALYGLSITASLFTARKYPT